MLSKLKSTTTTKLPSEDELIEFVYASNEIEGYTAQEFGPGTRIYDQHLSVAKWIAGNYGNPDTWEPNILHFRLMHNLLDVSEVGITRRKRVFIGGREAPEPGLHLSEHLLQWRALLNETPEDLGLDKGSYCWKIHNEFEMVHPYIDGNGRTSRLILNALRLNFGLPWLTIHPGREQNEYYDYLAWYWRKRFICERKI